MFKQVLENLTPSMKAELRAGGITDQMRSDWAHDRRYATAAQLLILADVAGVDPLPMLRELATFKAHPKEQKLLQRALGKAIAAGVAVMLVLCGVAGSAQLVGPNGSFRRR